MTTTMKAAVVREFGKPLTIDEVPVPAAGPGQILVKIAATGVCHTDLHAAVGDWPFKPKPPFIPGHEAQQNTGYSVNGSFAEYVVADPNYVGLLPIATETLDNINDVFARMRQGDMQGRVVIDFQE